MLLLLLLLCVVITAFSFCYVETVCGEYLDLIDYNYTLRCYTIRVCTCIYLRSTSAAAAAALQCVAILLLLQLLLLLLTAAVGHRVLDGKMCCCGSLHLIPVVSFSSFKHDSFSMYPLAVLCRIYSVEFLLIIRIIHPR